MFTSIGNYIYCHKPDESYQEIDYITDSELSFGPCFLEDSLQSYIEILPRGHQFTAASGFETVPCHPALPEFEPLKQRRDLSKGSIGSPSFFEKLRSGRKATGSIHTETQTHSRTGSIDKYINSFRGRTSSFFQRLGSGNRGQAKCAHSRAHTLPGWLYQSKVQGRPVERSITYPPPHFFDTSKKLFNPLSFLPGICNSSPPSPLRVRFLPTGSKNFCNNTTKRSSVNLFERNFGNLFSDTLVGTEEIFIFDELQHQQTHRRRSSNKLPSLRKLFSRPKPDSLKTLGSFFSAKKSEPDLDSQTCPKQTFIYPLIEKEKSHLSTMAGIPHLDPSSALLATSSPLMAITRQKSEAMRLAQEQGAAVMEMCRRAQTSAPPYIFEELIGKGAYGRVYKGFVSCIVRQILLANLQFHYSRNSRSQKIVAIKVLEIDTPDYKIVRDYKDESIKDFIHETKVLSQVKDAGARNVNMLIEAISIHSQLWLVCEYCPGGSVKTLVSLVSI